MASVDHGARGAGDSDEDGVDWWFASLHRSTRVPGLASESALESMRFSGSSTIGHVEPTSMSRRSHFVSGPLPRLTTRTHESLSRDKDDPALRFIRHEMHQGDNPVRLAAYV